MKDPAKESPRHQVGGDHYLKMTPQPIDLLRSWLTPAEYAGFLRGNIIKYLARYKEKGGVREYEFADYVATFFESGGRLSGSTWVVPTRLANEFLHLFVYGAQTLAEKDGIIYDDEYVWGYLINNKLIPSIVLSLGAHNWFGAIHKYNGVNHD